MVLRLLIVISLQFVITQCQKVDNATLKPSDNFSAENDARTLKGAIQVQYAEDPSAVRNLWFHRTHKERAEIQAYYDENFKHGDCNMVDLEADFKIDTTYDMENLYLDSFWSPQSLLGKTIHEVIHDIGHKGKDENSIEIIICGNDEVMKGHIEDFYSSPPNSDGTGGYSTKVEDDLKGFNKHNDEYQHVMLNNCWKGLNKENKIKPEDADKLAGELRAIDLDKNKDDFKKKLKELLDNNSEADMQMIFQKYRKSEDDGIDNAVDKAFHKVFDDRTRSAYNCLVRYIEDRCLFYAEELHDALAGLGTNYEKLNRIVLTRCEIDMGCILQRYETKYKKSFFDALKWDTLAESHYRQAIGFLCGQE